MDFHTHILPGMDDGSRDTDESLKMLALSREQGVSAVVATPHFYPEEEAPQRFLSRREAAVRRMLEGGYSWPAYPEVFLGAEVAFYDGICRSSQIGALCIEGTRLLLVEMPVCRWSDRMLEELYGLREGLGLLPVVAHVERYLPLQRRRTLDRLLEHGVLIQASASFFAARKTAWRAMRLFRRGSIHLLGSDCHNCTTRPPNLKAALDRIEKKVGAEQAERWSLLGRQLLEDASPLPGQTDAETAEAPLG